MCLLFLRITIRFKTKLNLRSELRWRTLKMRLCLCRKTLWRRWVITFFTQKMKMECEDLKHVKIDKKSNRMSSIKGWLILWSSLTDSLKILDIKKDNWTSRRKDHKKKWQVILKRQSKKSLWIDWKTIWIHLMLLRKILEIILERPQQHRLQMKFKKLLTEK